MLDSSGQDLTRILADVRAGRAGASAKLLSAVYNELRRIAQARLAQLPRGVSLQATELVHEAYLRMADDSVSWETRQEFFSAAAVAMRNVLVDRYRARTAKKRGGRLQKLELDDVPIARVPEELDFLALERALQLLDIYETRKSTIFMMRHYMGLAIDDIVAVYSVPRRTVERDLSFTRAWLKAHLDGPDTPPGGERA